jgi:hypothetical protein
MAAKPKKIRITGAQREELDVDVVVQVLIMLGRELWEAEQQERDPARPHVRRSAAQSLSDLEDAA